MLALNWPSELLGLRNPVHNTHGEMRLLPARLRPSAKSVVPEVILFGRRVPVDSHRAGGGRNRADPVTRHRNAGRCSERVAHFLGGLHDPL
jgi:hypothetical protein